MKMLIAILAFSFSASAFANFFDEIGGEDSEQSDSGTVVNSTVLHPPIKSTATAATTNGSNHLSKHAQPALCLDCQKRWQQCEQQQRSSSLSTFRPSFTGLYGCRISLQEVMYVCQQPHCTFPLSSPWLEKFTVRSALPAAAVSASSSFTRRLGETE